MKLRRLMLSNFDEKTLKFVSAERIITVIPDKINYLEQVDAEHTKVVFDNREVVVEGNLQKVEADIEL